MEYFVQGVRLEVNQIPSGSFVGGISPQGGADYGCTSTYEEEEINVQNHNQNHT